jgi:hypothetical protein
MRASVQSITSPDVDLDSFAPGSNDPIYTLVEMDIGSDEGEGADIFELVVCNPAGLQKRVSDAGPMFGHHHLVVAKWDWPQIRNLIVSTIEGEQAPTWDGLAARIGRIARWEFEDYRELPGGSA